jgi:hypothetical protein
MRTPRVRLSDKSWWSLVAWSGLLAGTASLVVVTGLANGLRNARPDAALALTPDDARALARRADTTLLAGSLSPANVGRARADARAALTRDATLPAAWRVLGLTEKDGSPASVRLLQTAQTLSRRDVPTQLALLELQVRKGDIVGALKHYDIILRISTAYDPMLFPVLAGAMVEPQILVPLSRRLAAAPMWRRRFLSYVVNAGTSFEGQSQLFTALSRTGAPVERDIVAASATNSALANQFAVAWQLYRLVAAAEAGQRLRNGGFEKTGGIAPFDWQLETGGPLNVVIAGSEGQHRLEMGSVRGDGGRAARQLLTLSPGRYRVRARFGTLDSQGAGLPNINVICADAPGSIAVAQATTGRDLIEVKGTVPTNCQYQWLELGLQLDRQGAETAVWIDGVVVDPVSEKAGPHPRT